MLSYRFSDGKQVIVFCASKLGCETLGFSLSKLFPCHMNETFQIDDPKLRILLPLGVAYHHAGGRFVAVLTQVTLLGMSADDRSTVETFFLQGLIRILCATSTLAHGVNLPAHLVIIKGSMISLRSVNSRLKL
jgi:replicative superfamily II helicase